MNRKFKGMIMAAAVLGVFGLSGFGEGGCGDEVIEKALCESATRKICDKWFSCWPAISKAAWVDVGACKATVSTFCSQSEDLLGCDINNDMLRKCDNGINGSTCGLLPAECKPVFTCYTK